MSRAGVRNQHIGDRLSALRERNRRLGRRSAELAGEVCHRDAQADRLLAAADRLRVKLEVAAGLLERAVAERDAARRDAERHWDELDRVPEFPTALDPALAGRPECGSERCSGCGGAA